MINLFKKRFSLLLVVVLTFGLLQINAYAKENESTEQKVYSGATLEDEFAEDRVLIVLNNKASLAVDQYEAETFSEIDCNSVINLNGAKEVAVQEKLNSISMELEALTTARNVTELVTTENIMKIAAEDEELSSYHQVFCIELEESGKDKVLGAIAELEKREDIFYAGPDYEMTVSFTTANDTHYNLQWAINMIQLPQAWDVTTGSSAVKVAVIDSGIDGDHPDLVSRIDTALCRSCSVDGAFVPDVLEDNYYNIWTGSYGHGTRVAGIIGAVGNNGVGVTGACWNVKLVSLKAFDADGVGYNSSVITAINFAEAQNIPIINLSAGWGEDDIGGGYNAAMYSAISNYSGLFVCSAGNDGRFIDQYEYYPANYSLSNIIVVGASTENEEIAEYSNFGRNNVDIFAPGDNIYSTDSTGSYSSASGTSFAAPYVAGVAALLLSKYPDMTAADLKETILANVDIEYDGWDNDIYGDYCTSGGRLNAYNALSNRVCAHTYAYTSRGVYSGHTCTCTKCGYTKTENHMWSEMPLMYQCVKCKQTSFSDPTVLSSSVHENE